MTSVYVLQGRSFRSIINVVHRLERLNPGVTFMTQTRIEKEKDPITVVEKKSERPAMNMRYQMMEIPKESSLKDTKDLYLERVTLSWQEGKKKLEETIVMFHHRPEVKKK